MYRAHAVLLAVMFAGPSAAAPEWIKVKSPNFEIYTTSGERDGRNTLVLFEQVRDFFMRVNSGAVTTRLPVTIVGFRNAKEYKPYQISESSAAYYTGDEQRDYIVMGDLGGEHAPLAIHEYMHLLIRHSGLKMPLWLNEGFADVYSTLKPVGGQILLGSPPPGRGSLLSREKWMPLDKLMSVGHDSPEYNEKDRAGVFYAQSWLLVHMLMLGDDYKDAFPKFVLALHETGSAGKAFETAWRRKPWEVEADLRAYFRGSSINGALFKTRFEKFKPEPAQPASEFEVEITLTKLTALLRRYGEAKDRYRRLAAAYPDKPEIPEALAHLHWREGARDLAIEQFARAVQLGAAGWKTHWDYARLLGPGADPDAYQSALRKTLEQRPDLLEARLALGAELIRRRMWGAAFVTLREAKNVVPDRAADLFLMLAQCAMSLDKREEARKYALEAQQWAKEQRHKDYAGRLIALLDRPMPAPAPIEARETGPEPAQPVIRRREREEMAVAEIRPSHPEYKTVRGNFKRLDCLGEMARMHVMDGRDTFRLLIRSPQSVTIRGTGGTIEMTCGPQNLSVSVAFIPWLEEKFGATGEVREIEILE